jgi:DNA recombination protein RmuC
MFVPSDGIYQAALAADPALIEYGVAQQVLMATPTTLIGLLRAVHYGWGQEQIAESAREIAGSARELHRRMGKFAEHLAKVGRQLGSAVNAYNDTVGSFDHRVIPQLRGIEAAGVASEREIAAPAAIEPTPRPVTARLQVEPDVLESAIAEATPIAEARATSITARRLASEAAAVEAAEPPVASEARR